MTARFLFDGLARDAPHQVDAELEALAVHVVRERLKPCAVGSGGEAVDSGQQAAPFVHHELGVPPVVVAGGIRLIPLDVHYDVLPPVGLEVLGHVVCVGLGLCLGHGGGKAVPTVPAHGRGCSPGVEGEALNR